MCHKKVINQGKFQALLPERMGEENLSEILKSFSLFSISLCNAHCSDISDYFTTNRIRIKIFYNHFLNSCS